MPRKCRINFFIECKSRSNICTSRSS